MTAPTAATVIVVSRDRRDELAAALDSLERQQVPAACFEVIVVDDGSRDGTFEALARRAAADHGPRLLVLRNAAPQGPGAARQLAARRARGDALVFLDSDCVAHPAWLGALLAPLADSAVGVVGGAEALDPDEALVGRVLHVVLTSFLTTGGLRGRAGARLGRYRPRTFSMAVPRAAFHRAGGFTLARHGEDLDLSQRIARLGLRAVYAPEAVVHHRRRRSLRTFARQAFGMGRARALLIRRDPGHAEAAFLLPAAVVAGAAATVGAALLGRVPRRVGAAASAAAGLYLAAVGAAAAVRLREPRAMVLAPAAFVTGLVAYGVGLLAAAARPPRAERVEDVAPAAPE